HRLRSVLVHADVDVSEQDLIERGLIDLHVRGRAHVERLPRLAHDPTDGQVVEDASLRSRIRRRVVDTDPGAVGSAADREVGELTPAAGFYFQHGAATRAGPEDLSRSLEAPDAVVARTEQRQSFAVRDLERARDAVRAWGEEQDVTAAEGPNGHIDGHAV